LTIHALAVEFIVAPDGVEGISRALCGDVVTGVHFILDQKPLSEF